MSKNTAIFYGLLVVLSAVCIGCDNDFDALYKESRRKMTFHDGMNFFYYANVDVSIETNRDQYKNLLVFVHGAGLDASEHFNAAVKAIRSAGLTENTIVLAPHFQKEKTDSNYYWTKYSWKDGRKSINAVPKISSYSVLDSLLIKEMLSNYPEINTVVISGHSAGAQFVYRYSLLSKLEESIAQEIHYLPLNPSSVTYLGPERWNAAKDRFEIPLNAPSCPGYDTWIYGISDVSANEYDREITTDDILSYYPSRNVTIGIGTLDLEGQGGGDGCEELYQGVHRYERAHNVHNHMDVFFPGHSHRIIDVEGVDHDRYRMMTSPEIIDFLNEVFE